MAVEIIKPGKNPKDEWVYFNCDRCGCEFRMTANETKACHVQTDYNDFVTMYEGDCPTCGKRLYGKGEVDFNKVKELEDWALHGITNCGPFGRK